jgi:hypothetical protein
VSKENSPFRSATLRFAPVDSFLVPSAAAHRAGRLAAENLTTVVTDWLEPGTIGFATAQTRFFGNE